MSWRNRTNGFFVGAIHYTADPAKRNPEWFAKATQLFKPWQIDREWNISFKSKAGAKAFGYLLDQPKRWRVPNMDLDKIPKHWRIVAGLDYGTTNPTSIHFYAIDPMRRIYSVFEYYAPSNIRIIARVLKGNYVGPNKDGEEKDYRHPLWRRCEKVVVDGAIYNKNQETGGEGMTSVGDLLEEQGIYGIERATKDRVAGLGRLHDAFSPNLSDPEQEPSLFFCTRCVEQWREFTSVIYAENAEHAALSKNAPEDIVPKDDHAYDETRYVVMAVAAPSDEAYTPPPEEGTLGAVEKEMDLDDADRDEVDYY